MLPAVRARVLWLGTLALIGCTDATTSGAGAGRGAATPGRTAPGALTAEGGPDVGSQACPQGRLAVNGACCWPGQHVAQGRCEGEPQCPAGTVGAGTECRPADAELASAAAACGVDADAGGYAAAVARMGACQKLTTFGAAAASYLTYRCEHGDGGSCALLGHAARRQMSLPIEAELVSPPCQTKAASCAGQVQRTLPFDFAFVASGSPDPAAARARYEQACSAGNQDGCMVLAELSAQSNPFGAAQRYGAACRLGRTAACSLAIYLFRAAGRVEDPALQNDIARQLGQQCDRGVASACNALGFAVERGMGAPLSPEGGRALYGRACRAGDALGCANLAFTVVNDPKLASQVALDAAALALLATSCRSDEIKEVCLAHAVVLGRGLGTKKDAAQARAILKPLCDKGYREACRER